MIRRLTAYVGPSHSSSCPSGGGLCRAPMVWCAAKAFGGAPSRSRLAAIAKQCEQLRCSGMARRRCKSREESSSARRS